MTTKRIRAFWADASKRYELPGGHSILSHNYLANRIALRVPIITMVLAATAIPVELRSPRIDAWNFQVFTGDLLANLLGYVPVGIVLGGLGPFLAISTAAVLTILAETTQLAMMHRDPSIADILSNVVGAGFGVLIASYWRIRSPELRISRGNAQIAALLPVMLGVGVWATTGDPINTRGLTSPGRMEAFWKFDQDTGRIAEDSSGLGVIGRFAGKPTLVSSVARRAVLLDDENSYINFGHPSSLRLAGSMTISAWINSTSYPFDDAAIVSSYNSSSLVSGYELSTTVNRGRRTIGFKIAGECGHLTVRYGATPLAVGAWYHVAGVYDASTRRLNVYLNGEPDDGVLLGSVPGAQRASRSNVYLGRRSDRADFEFAGFIDDVRVYSRALTKGEIVSDMQGHAIDGLGAERAQGTGTGRRRTYVRDDISQARCAVLSDNEDDKIPIAAAGIGVFLAVACIGLRPSMGNLVCLPVSLVAGFLLLLLTASTLPPINFWLVPLTSLAGAAAVVVSVRSGQLS